MRLFTVILLSGFLFACVKEPSVTKSSENLAATVRSIDGVSALLGQEFAKITVTRMGVDGSIDAELAKALGASPLPGQQLTSGDYRASDLELKMDGLLRSHPEFGSLVSLLDPYEVDQLKANATFVVEFARTTETEVEYQPGKYRRSLYLEISVLFRLLDAQGRLAFEHRTYDHAIRICLLDSETPCNDLDGSPLDQKQLWKGLVTRVWGQAIHDSQQQLIAWNGLLEDLETKVVKNIRGESVQIKQNGAKIRHDGNHSYLFLRVPDAGVKRLVSDLVKNGETLNDASKDALSRNSVTILRSSLDQALRKKLKESDLTAQAGIFLLPDAQAQWYRDALARVVTDAVNDNEMIDVNGESQLPEYLQAYGDPCSRSVRKTQQNLCLDVKMVFGRSEHVEGEEMGGVKNVQQVASVSGLLIDSQIKRSQDPNNLRFYPHSLELAKRMTSATGVSDDYLSVVNAPAESKDDRVYLHRAAMDAVMMLGPQIGDHVLQTFYEELQDRPTGLNQARADFQGNDYE